jgi:hypothetical protein
VGHGESVQVVECRLCGWSQRWDLTQDIDYGNGGDAA